MHTASIFITLSLLYSDNLAFKQVLLSTPLELLELLSQSAVSF